MASDDVWASGPNQSRQPVPHLYYESCCWVGITTNFKSSPSISLTVSTLRQSPLPGMGKRKQGAPMPLEPTGLGGHCARDSADVTYTALHPLHTADLVGTLNERQ